MPATIADALELLTAQHAELDLYVTHLIACRDPAERSTALAHLADRLTAHLAAKQEVFYPALGGLVSRDVLAEVIAEHTEIRRTLGDLVWLDVDDAQFDARLASLASLLRGHTDWQEGWLFVAAAEALPAPQLAELGQELATWHEHTDVYQLAA
jgi:hemerythrin HHE cation binding domain-containing protein